ncbi:SLATT domain-containing protein [Brucella intermedia]|uniref:SLATT domain-containing protein n=1 Tax=Brucella intermedia TaxID=94625 RepID=UPI0023612510|nr:SLATT domain-containing protein [Brucella intermedia]
MDRKHALRAIAETGYNVGFGAKKHFATFDIVEKAPGWIGFVSMAVGIFALVFDSLSAKTPSALLLIAGVVSLYIAFYRSSEYGEAGEKLTRIYNELRNLYFTVQSDQNSDISSTMIKLKALESEFYGASISRQILFSDWYAHIKFFGQHQHQWVNEQLQFQFWRDKVPATFKIMIFVLVLAVLFASLVCYGFPQVLQNGLNYIFEYSTG